LASSKELKAAEVQDMKRELEIFVGERRIPTNQFATQIIISTLTGLLKPLKHVDTEQRIRITVGALEQSQE
jgi:hypothetical protein